MLLSLANVTLGFIVAFTRRAEGIRRGSRGSEGEGSRRGLGGLARADGAEGGARGSKARGRGPLRALFCRRKLELHF